MWRLEAQHQVKRQYVERTDNMNRFIICAFLIIQNVFISYAEKFIVVIPAKQIRKNPARIDMRTSPPYMKMPHLNAYSPIKLGPNGQTSSLTDFYQNRDEMNSPHTPYGKGVNYLTNSRGYMTPYDKLRGFVPLINQNRYPADINKLRYPLNSDYAPANSVYYHRVIKGDLTNKKLPTNQQPVDQLQSTFPNLPSSQPIINHSLTTHQRSMQQAASNVYPKFESVKVIKNQQDAIRTGDLLKESSNAVETTQAPPAIGPGKEIVFRDTILLDDYEKKIAEFTKSWSKLSAYSRNFDNPTSLFPGSSSNPSATGIARSSNNLNLSEKINRKGYEVREEINEPIINFRTMPIINSPVNAFPTPTTFFVPKVFG